MTTSDHDDLTPTHPWDLYAATRDRLIALVRPLADGDETGAARTVALTPGWTVAQVVAHVCGLNADVAAGMRQGMGTDERTAHQVATRAGRTVAQVCDEWLGHAEAMRAAIDDDPFFGRRLAADLVVHLHDVQHTLGQVVDRDDEATLSAGRTYATRIPDLVAEATGGRVALTIELVDAAERAGADGSEPTPVSAGLAEGPASLVLRATPYDVLRSVTGRRSRAQVAALDWSGDPTPVLDHLCPYGPLRTTDAAI